MSFLLKNISVELMGKRVLKNISLLTVEGEIFCIIGTSGAGKSTLLRTLNRLQSINEGEMLLNGQPIYEMSPQKLRKNATMILQTPSLMEGTVKDNILFGLQFNGQIQNNKDELALSLLTKVGLEEELLERNASSLSIGQQQRVSIARSLALKPKILLCDEITSALDPQSTIHIQELLIDLKRNEKTTVILVTHNMDLVQQIADRVGLLMNGQLVEVSETKDFFNNPSTEYGKNFLFTIA